MGLQSLTARCGFAAALSFCSFQVCAEQVMNVNIDRSNAEFQVTLPANPTTGFQWYVKQYDHKLINFKSQQFVAPQRKLIGAGGKTHFTFQWIGRPPESTKTVILFKYARSWEPESATITKVIVNVN
jgi:inhibitor of cysteine peptidase